MEYIVYSSVNKEILDQRAGEVENEPDLTVKMR